MLVTGFCSTLVLERISLKTAPCKGWHESGQGSAARSQTSRQTSARPALVRLVMIGREGPNGKRYAEMQEIGSTQQRGGMTRSDSWATENKLASHDKMLPHQPPSSPTCNEAVNARSMHRKWHTEVEHHQGCPARLDTNAESGQSAASATWPHFKEAASAACAQLARAPVFPPLSRAYQNHALPNSPIGSPAHCRERTFWGWPSWPSYQMYSAFWARALTRTATKRACEQEGQQWRPARQRAGSADSSHRNSERKIVFCLH